LRHQTMDKVQKYNSFNTNTPSSESYRNYLCNIRNDFCLQIRVQLLCSPDDISIWRKPPQRCGILWK